MNATSFRLIHGAVLVLACPSVAFVARCATPARIGGTFNKPGAFLSNAHYVYPVTVVTGIGVTYGTVASYLLKKKKNVVRKVMRY